MAKKKFFIWLLVLVLGVVLIFSAYSWFLNKQERVLNGTARPDFPYSDYSTVELNQLYPQEPENNAPTVQSPEQTHAKFLAAVKKGDFDEAVNCCFREGDRVGMKAHLEDLKNKGLLGVMLSDIKEIRKDYEDSWTRTYVFSGISKGEKTAGFLEFIKTTSGIWYLKSF